MIARLGVGQRLSQQSGEGGGARESEVNAVGLEPIAVPGAEGDPIQQDAPFGMSLGSRADGVSVAARPAAKLERGDQAEDPFRANYVEGLLELMGGDARVRSEGDHNQVWKVGPDPLSWTL
ncbi:MAG: hypothetical protein JJE35_07135 [Thermoleophilia bacterium]|nr:hypothetical protein [Thermoleophilia bacterium]